MMSTLELIQRVLDSDCAEEVQKRTLITWLTQNYYQTVDGWAEAFCEVCRQNTLSHQQSGLESFFKDCGVFAKGLTLRVVLDIEMEQENNNLHYGENPGRDYGLTSKVADLIQNIPEIKVCVWRDYNTQTAFLAHNKERGLR